MTDTFHLKLEGADLYAAALTKLDMACRRRIVTAATRAGAKEIVQIARQLAPVRTGDLKRQIGTSLKFDRVRGTVVSTIRAKRTGADKKHGRRSAARYAHLVVTGTNPHAIAANQADAITVNGKAYRHVSHPGAKPNPFMDQAARLGFPAAVRAFDFKFSERLIAEQTKLRKLEPTL